MELLHLETIHAMNAVAAQYEGQAADARRIAAIDITGAEEEKRRIKAEWETDAAKYDIIAAELRGVAKEEARKRSYNTARWLTNVDSGIDPTEARGLIAAIAETPSVTEYHTHNVVRENENCAYHIRLVYYHDYIAETNRWAVEYITDRSTPGISDNALREDAEYRYWEIASMMGQPRP